MKNQISPFRPTLREQFINGITEFMKNNGLQESHTNNSLKTNLACDELLEANMSFYDIDKRDHIISFLDSKTFA